MTKRTDMDLQEARRCVHACAKYLREHDESPRAAKDLIEAVRVIEEHARVAGLAVKTKPKPR